MTGHAEGPRHRHPRFPRVPHLRRRASFAGLGAAQFRPRVRPATVRLPAGHKGGKGCLCPVVAAFAAYHHQQLLLLLQVHVLTRVMKFLRGIRGLCVPRERERERERTGWVGMGVIIAVSFGRLIEMLRELAVALMRVE